MYWLALIFGILLLALFLYWLLVTTEGVYLGRRVVVWLYDLTAHRYDAIKEYKPDDERLLVNLPVQAAARGIESPLLLDVATGTGRVPFDLLDRGGFDGIIVALDDSARMLAVARQKLAPFAGRVRLLRHPATPLPFPDDHFDVITCLEALEFFPSDAAALQEMVRVLRPGCTLLVTRRRGWEGRAFLHRYRSEADMRALLAEMGLENIHFHPWQENYDLVSARKPRAPR